MKTVQPDMRKFSSIFDDAGKWGLSRQSPKITRKLLANNKNLNEFAFEILDTCTSHYP